MNYPNFEVILVDNGSKDNSIALSKDAGARVIIEKRKGYGNALRRGIQEALGKYPQDASLYQSLGDAYLHSNMLDEALDAYNRAEDLIK